MKIQTEYNAIDIRQWRELVAASPVATWFQTPEAYCFFASLPGMMMPFSFAVENGGELKGVVVGYVTREKNPIKQFFTRRAIVYGGPLLAENISDEELKCLLFSLCSMLKNKAIYIETRNFCDYSRWRAVFEQYGFVYQPHYDIHIYSGDKEQMISRISESRLRQIRRAEAEGFEVKEAATTEEIKSFYMLLKSLYKTKVHTPLFPLDFFTTFVQQKRGVLLLVIQQEKIVGGILCPILDNRVLYEWFIVGPVVVTWAAMKYANIHNIPLFDLMGAGKPDEHYGVRDFKMRFGGRQVEYGRFLMICNKTLYKIGQVGVRMLKTGK